MENEAQIGIQEGQNLNSTVIVCSNEDDMKINQDKTLDAVAIIEQNVPVPANEDNFSDASSARKRSNSCLTLEGETE
ncbi:uncharacterized protein [Primulina huaijiensis]|uniref:uncharacterized protein isoform X7 n=1 Tax=Primulina huaijiensis TaxID=1492673 RepID=UPI003CC6FD6B